MHLKKYNFVSLIIMVLLLQGFSLSMQAQHGDIEDKVVIIEKEAKLELPVANRNFEKVVYEAPAFQNKRLDYDFTDVNFDLPRLPAKIKVPTIPPDPLTKLYGNYLKAGFGNYATPYLEGFINSKRSEQYNVGMHLKHLSSGNGSVKSDKISGLSGTSVNEVDAYGHYFTNDLVLKSRLGFASRGYNYYGFDVKSLDKPAADAKRVEDSIKQRYNTFFILAGLANKDKSAAVNYEAGIQYYHFNDRYTASEHEVLTEGGASYAIDSTSGIHLKGLLSYSRRKDSTTMGRTFFQLKPWYYFTYEKFRFRVGFNVAYTNDTIKAYNKLHLYPTLYGEYEVADKLLTAFAGVGGEMQKNTLRSFIAENPYLIRRAPLAHTNKSLELFVGGMGNFTEKANYFVKFSYMNYKNLYFYNNAVSDTSRFAVFYARGTSNVVNFSGDVSYEIIEKLRLGLQTSFTGYSISSDTIQSWHRPNTQVSLYGTYNLYEKINFNANFNYLGGLKGRNFITGKKQDRALPAVIDLNLKVDYNVSSVFSVFIEFNNLISKKYQLYQYYPVKGINILGGISYSF